MFSPSVCIYICGIYVVLFGVWYDMARYCILLYRIYYIFGKITARGFNKAKFKVKACSSSGLRELGGNPHTEEAREK